MRYWSHGDGEDAGRQHHLAESVRDVWPRGLHRPQAWAHHLAKRGRKDEVTFVMATDERAAAERTARARAQPAWQHVVRERAMAEKKAKEVREARERAMTNGQAQPRAKPRTRTGPSVMAGIGEAVH